MLWNNISTNYQRKILYQIMALVQFNAKKLTLISLSEIFSFGIELNQDDNFLQ